MEDDAETRDTIRVLLASMDYQCVFASDFKQALAALEHENPALGIVDLQGKEWSVAAADLEFGKIMARLRGRVISVTGVACSPEISKLINRYSLPHIQRGRLVQELWPSLESLLRPRGALLRTTHLARLVFDSLLEPLPAGARAWRPDTRRLVYQSGPFSADVSFEPQTDSRRMAVVGQIVDSTNLHRKLEGIPVVLHGQKGPIALGMSNEFGEFHFDFDFEPSVTIELETSKNHWITLVSPSMEWTAKAASASSQPS